jgi:anti-sigma B factor antagonist
MRIESGNNWARVFLSGDVDMAWVEQHQDEFDSLCRDEPATVVLDLEAVTFMDSTGFGLIAKLSKTCRANGGKVYIYKPSAMVLTAIDTLGLAQVAGIVIARCPEELRLATTGRFQT